MDAVSICTPPELHYFQTKKCLEAGLHVLCEKPFILTKEENYNKSKELFKLAKSKEKILLVNTQLTSLLQYVSKKNLKNIRNFSMYMESGSGDANHLMVESLPHMNSLLIKIFGERKINHINFERKKDELKIFFIYGLCKVEYKIGIKDTRPRKLFFLINEKRFERKINMDEDYQMYLSYDGKKIKMKDPLKESISNFIYSIKKNEYSLNDEKEILQNVKLQDVLIKEYATSQ